jgi:integrase
MAYATSSGELRLNWQRKDVGRITRVSGETTPRALAQCHALLDKLYRKGHLDVLDALRDGQLSMRQIRQLDKSGRIDWDAEYLGDALVGLQPVWPAIERTLPRMGGSLATRRRYAYSFQALAEVAQLDRLTIDELARVDWSGLLAQWPNGPVDWNHLRTAVSRFLTLSLGSVHHPVRRRVMEAMPKARTTERVSTLTLDGLAAIMPHIRPALRPAVLTLAITGMRVGELYACRPEHLSPAGDVVLLSVPTVTDDDRRARRAHKDARSKTGGRLIVVDAQLLPTVQAAIPVPTSYKMLYRAFKRAATQAGLPQVTIHDLRHLYAAELTEATSVSIAQKALGHATPGMTLRYAMRSDVKRAATTAARLFAGIPR